MAPMYLLKDFASSTEKIPSEVNFSMSNICISLFSTLSGGASRTALSVT